MSRSETGSRTALSRVTLVGERRRVDLVLPSREPVGVLLPEVMRVLGDPVAEQSEPRHLVTSDGSALASDSTLESAGVLDGAVLRLVRLDDAPSATAAPEFTDRVTDDEGAYDFDVRVWRWSPTAGRVAAGGATVLWAVTAGILARGHFDPAAVGAWLLAVAPACAAAGLLCGRARRHALAATLIVTAAALAALGAWTCADAYGWDGAGRLAGVAGTAALALLLAGRFTALGRGALIGAGSVAGCLVAWEAAIGLQGGTGTAVQQARAGALIAVVCVVALGALPRLALMASGLTGLDDRRAGGASVSRYAVTTALAAGHRGLVLATVVLAGSTGVAGVLVLRAVSVWTVSLGVVVTVLLALRARAFPLTAEVVALLVAAAVVGVRLVAVWSTHAPAAGPLTALGVLAAVPLMVLAVQPTEQVRVRLRRVGDLLETAAVIALFPLVIGVFGVYGQLLGTSA